MAKGVWLVAEQRDGDFRKTSFEIASTARKLADELGEEVCAILLGYGIEGIAGDLGKYGVDRVYVADDAVFEQYTTDAYSAAVGKVIAENDPSILLLAASIQGKDLSSRLVGKLATGMATDCVDLKIVDGNFTFQVDHLQSRFGFLRKNFRFLEFRNKLGNGCVELKVSFFVKHHHGHAGNRLAH